MDALIKSKRGETEAHVQLKRLALLWAQTQGYSACALEVSLPRCRYRADLAAYRPEGRRMGATAIFECKQALVDLRRDNGSTHATTKRLEAIYQRRQILEKKLRVHYPALRVPDSLFVEFDSHDFAAIEHRGYNRVLREFKALQNRLFDSTKFETLVRYRCANLFFLVLSSECFRESEIPPGWGALVQLEDGLVLSRKPAWHEVPDKDRHRFLERIAVSATRRLNRELEIAFEDVVSVRARS